MPDQRRVLRLEKKLGFIWADKGISKLRGESCKVGVIKDMIKDVDKVKVESVNILPSELRRSSRFERHCSALFEKHAPRIWAPQPTDRSAWLVDAAENDWDGLYTRDLYVGKHDAELYELFTTMVFEKCVRYHENKKQQRRRASKKEDSSSTDSDLDEDITVWTQYMRRGTAAGAEFPKSKAKQNGHNQERRTAGITESPERPHVAPVAQMTPRQPQSSDGHEYLNKVIAGGGTDSSSTQQKHPSDPIYLSDDDSQPTKRAECKPMAHDSDRTASLSKPPEVDTTRPPAAEQPRKRLGVTDYSDVFEGSTSSDRKKKQKVSHNSKLLATFRFTPERLAPILQDTPKRENEVLESSDQTGAQRPTKKSKTTIDDDITPLSHLGKQFAPSSKSRLKIRLSNTKRSPTSNNQPLSRPNETPDLDTTVSNSAANPSSDHVGLPGREDRHTLRPDLRDNKVPVAASSEEHVSATGPNSKSSSHPSANGNPSTSSHRLGVEPNASISEVGTTHKEFDSPEAHEHAAQAESTQPLANDVGQTPVSKDKNHSSEATQRQTSYLFDGCNPQSPEASQVSFQKANNGLLNAMPPEDVNEGTTSSNTEPSTGLDRTELQPKTAEVDQAALSEAMAPYQTAHTAVVPIKLNKDTKTPFEVNQSDFLDDQSKSLPSMETIRPSKELGEEVKPRKLFIRLNTTEANKQQYVAVTFDSSIEELFSKIQNRMTRRLASKEILALDLRLPSQREEEDDFLVEKNDPDTWELFLDMAREEMGDKVIVTATVAI